MYEYVDSHIHLYQFSENERKLILNKKEFIFISVSEDLNSSLENLRLSYLYENVIPSIGIHPWNIEKAKKEDLEIIKKIINRENIKVLGEIGLDKRFAKDSYDKQKDFFIEFLNIAKEYDLSLNLHTLDSWREVLDLLIKYDIKKAVFHWYTGPLDLIEEIKNAGYFIGINPAFFVQEKHKKVLEHSDLSIILTESDAPYEYKNIFLHPDKIKEVIQEISKIFKISTKDVIIIIKNNLSKFLL